MVPYQWIKDEVAAEERLREAVRSRDIAAGSKALADLIDIRVLIHTYEQLEADMTDNRNEQESKTGGTGVAGQHEAQRASKEGPTGQNIQTGDSSSDTTSQSTGGSTGSESSAKND